MGEGGEVNLLVLFQDVAKEIASLRESVDALAVEVAKAREEFLTELIPVILDFWEFIEKEGLTWRSR